MPDLDRLAMLRAAVAGIGGAQRDGQVAMVRAVDQAIETGRHLVVQAGTGTGKSLAYLAPVLDRLVGTKDRIVVATATLALQAQLAKKDVPAALDAVEEVTGARPRVAVLKGRTNYACLFRARSGGTGAQATLLGVQDLEQPAGTDDVSRLGREVLALREWVEDQASGTGPADRDDAPPHTAAAWQQVSIPTRECLGATCPFNAECFVEASRVEARSAQLIITNHALLAINAMHGGTALPEHVALVVDEAHELTSRLTTAATDELAPPLVDRVARRALPWLDDDLGADFLGCGDDLRDALAESALERVLDPGAPLVLAAARIRDLSRSVVSALGGSQTDPDKTQASAAVQEVFDISARIAALADSDVVWVSESDGRMRTAWVAPLDVAGLLRTRVFAETATICTSATLTLGGEFAPFARSLGLSAGDEVRTSGDEAASDRAVWRAVDVGSPFDYQRQGILYAARHLPKPGRDGLGDEVLAQIAQLVWAAGGRTLGLFASRRAAEQAAQYCREELPEFEILCQGDSQLPELQRRFVAEQETSLFGTMSLWQGVDVPGETCQLVIIDKIPFPRPDDPLMQARKRAVDDSGGNGFMSVAASHAALLLAQGAGRLIRRSEDRGVVAILDPRLVTARYGSFLAHSLPRFWTTTDVDVAVQALRRLRGLE